MLLAVVGCVGLSACSPSGEAVAASGPQAGVAASALAPNTGRILQILQAAGYTYAELETRDGKVWIAGSPIEAKQGDIVQWGDHAVMHNFHSKTLNRNFDQILFVNAWGPVGGAPAQMAPHGDPQGNPHAAMPGHPPVAGAPSMPAAAGGGGDQGVVKSAVTAGGYTYLEVDQGGSAVWVATTESPLKAGDKVRWEGGSVMANFTAKSLGRTFDQLILAGQVSKVQ